MRYTVVVMIRPCDVIRSTTTHIDAPDLVTLFARADAWIREYCADWGDGIEYEAYHLGELVYANSVEFWEPPVRLTAPVSFDPFARPSTS